MLFLMIATVEFRSNGPRYRPLLLDLAGEMDRYFRVAVKFRMVIKKNVCMSSGRVELN